MADACTAVTLSAWIFGPYSVKDDSKANTHLSRICFLYIDILCYFKFTYISPFCFQQSHKFRKIEKKSRFPSSCCAIAVAWRTSCTIEQGKQNGWFERQIGSQHRESISDFSLRRRCAECIWFEVFSTKSDHFDELSTSTHHKGNFLIRHQIIQIFNNQ